MPGPRSLVDTFVSRLEKLEIPYVVTGAIASIIYGEPRLTNDVDLIMMMKREDIERFVGEIDSRLDVLVCVHFALPVLHRGGGCSKLFAVDADFTRLGWAPRFLGSVALSSLARRSDL